MLHRFQCNVKGGIRKQPGIAFGNTVGNGISFCMGEAGFFVKSGADDLILVNGDSALRRDWGWLVRALFRQVQWPVSSSGHPDPLRSWGPCIADHGKRTIEMCVEEYSDLTNVPSFFFYPVAIVNNTGFAFKMNVVCLFANVNKFR